MPQSINRPYHMPLHDDLLVLATSLVPQYVPPYPAAPAEANLRRGVSTAYYALFHLIVGEAMIRIVADPTLRSRVAPGLTHHNSESGLAGKPCLLVKSKLLDHILATFR